MLYLPVPSGTIATAGSWHARSLQHSSIDDKTQPAVPSPPQTTIRNDWSLRNEYKLKWKRCVE